MSSIKEALPWLGLGWVFLVAFCLTVLALRWRVHRRRMAAHRLEEARYEFMRTRSARVTFGSLTDPYAVKVESDWRPDTGDRFAPHFDKPNPFAGGTKAHANRQRFLDRKAEDLDRRQTAARDDDGGGFLTGLVVGEVLAGRGGGSVSSEPDNSIEPGGGSFGGGGASGDYSSSPSSDSSSSSFDSGGSSSGGGGGS